MKKTIEELQRYLREIASFSLPKYKELPSVELYMEQVLSFVNGALSSLHPNSEKALTSFMVNNYVKAKLIDEPVKKRYSRDQIGYLIGICLLKSTLTISDVSVLLDMDEGVSPSKERLYAFFCDLETGILSDMAKKTSSRVEEIAKRHKLESGRKGKNADQNAADSLGLLALHLAIQAQANKLLSQYIIEALRQNAPVDREKALASGKDEKKLESEGKKEAKRLAEEKEESKAKESKMAKAEKKKKQKEEKAELKKAKKQGKI